MVGLTCGVFVMGERAIAKTDLPMPLALAQAKFRRVSIIAFAAL